MPRAPTFGLAGAAVAAAIVLLVVKAQQGDAPVSQPGGGSATKIEPVVIAPERAVPAPAEAVPRDVTAELAAEPAAITSSYAQTVRELLAEASRVRASWPADRQRDFDAHVTALQKKAALATDERPRRDAYRKLIRYLQRASIHDDVALASGGVTP